MATPLQIQANRLNALKSTGPRTPEGKAASRLNALKTGIDARSHVIPGEDAEELQSLAADYHARFQPDAPDESFLVDSLVTAEWQLRRLRRIEAQLWHSKLADASEAGHAEPSALLGSVFSASERDFTRLQRRIDSTERTYHRALKELRRIQAEREQPAPPPPDAACSLEANAPSPAAAEAAAVRGPQTLCSEFGFVPSSPVRTFAAPLANRDGRSSRPDSVVAPSRRRVTRI